MLPFLLALYSREPPGHPPPHTETTREQRPAKIVKNVGEHQPALTGQFTTLHEDSQGPWKHHSSRWDQVGGERKGKFEVGRDYRE